MQGVPLNIPTSNCCTSCLIFKLYSKHTNNHIFVIHTYTNLKSQHQSFDEIGVKQKTEMKGCMDII